MPVDIKRDTNCIKDGIELKSSGCWQRRCQGHPEAAIRENTNWPRPSLTPNTSVRVHECKNSRQEACLCLRVKVNIYLPPAATSGEKVSKC